MRTKILMTLLFFLLALSLVGNYVLYQELRPDPASDSVPFFLHVSTTGWSEEDKFEAQRLHREYRANIEALELRNGVEKSGMREQYERMHENSIDNLLREGDTRDSYN